VTVLETATSTSPGWEDQLRFMANRAQVKFAQGPASRPAVDGGRSSFHGEVDAVEEAGGERDLGQGTGGRIAR